LKRASGELWRLKKKIKTAIYHNKGICQQMAIPQIRKKVRLAQNNGDYY
jgi:hypothetical protein